MATKTVYVASAVAIAAAVLGFAGYKQYETRKANDDQELMVTGSDGTLVSNGGKNIEEGLPTGSSIGDGNMGAGPGNQPNTGSAMNGFQRGGTMGGNPGVRPSQPRTDGGSGMGMGRRQGGGGNAVSPGGSPGAGNPGGGGAPGRPGGGQARPQGGEMDFFGMGVALLADPKVQSELKLSAAQKAAVTQALKPPKDVENSEDMGAQVQNYMSRAGEQGAKVKTILDDNQEKRYVQLVHQQMGPVMMMNGSAREKFAVGDDEMKKITEIMTAASGDFQKSMQSGQMPNMDAIAKVKIEMDKKVIAALDDDSRAKWKAATGAPFTFSSPGGLGGLMGGMGMGRGMGGRGGAPGGGGPGGRRQGGGN